MVTSLKVCISPSCQCTSIPQIINVNVPRLGRMNEGYPHYISDRQKSVVYFRLIFIKLVTEVEYCI